MKRAISIILAALLIFGVSVSAFAENTDIPEIPTNEETTNEPTTEEESTQPSTDAEEETTEPEISDDPDEKVATLSICSCMSTPVVAGHTYIYVQNLSDEPIEVGLYEVPVGQGVSVGTLSISVHDGWGIYYNIETYREPREGHIPQIWSKTIELDKADLEKLDKKLDKFVNYWGPFFNCSFFAFSVWNNVSGDFLIPLVIPGLSHLIVQAVGEKGVLDMYKADASQVFKQRGTGEDAYLEPVGEKTLEIG